MAKKKNAKTDKTSVDMKVQQGKLSYTTGGIANHFVKQVFIL